MDFLRVIESLGDRLDKAGVRYALIGGFGMAMRGVQRATVDLDFLILLDDLQQADQVLVSLGFQRTFQSDNVSHYRALDEDWGRVDLLHAFRPASLGMLERAERLQVARGVSLPVAAREDIVGLKVQAGFNDPRRQQQDWADIRMLVQSAGDQGDSLDFDLIADYLELFECLDRIQEIKDWYEQAQP